MNTKDKNTAVLLLHCADSSGIIALVTEFINVNNGNIIYLDQHTNTHENKFFMRVEWSLDDFLIPQDKIADYFTQYIAKIFNMQFKIYFHNSCSCMALFVSKQAHCLYDILAHYEAGDWNVTIPFIISNHPDLEYVAKKFGIPFYYFPITKENKKEQEAKELELLKKHHVTFIVLARYMQIISPLFIQSYPNKIINIHHSFLPAFVGAKPYHAAFERGVKIIGATSHYITKELDAGPIIKQDVARISHKDDLTQLIRKGQDLEKVVLSRAIEKHIDRKILSCNNKTIVFS